MDRESIARGGFNSKVAYELDECLRAIRKASDTGRNSLMVTFEIDEKEVYQQIKNILEDMGYVVIMDGNNVTQQLSVCWLPEQMKKEEENER